MSTVCEIAKDLIPMYLDGTCSKPAERLVKKHIKGCKSCAKYYNICKHSDADSRVLAKKSGKISELIFAPDDGYALIAKRVGKSVLMERIALISGAVAAIITTIIIFTVKEKKDKVK